MGKFSEVDKKTLEAIARSGAYIADDGQVRYLNRPWESDLEYLLYNDDATSRVLEMLQVVEENLETISKIMDGWKKHKEGHKDFMDRNGEDFEDAYAYTKNMLASNPLAITEYLWRKLSGI